MPFRQVCIRLLNRDDFAVIFFSNRILNNFKELRISGHRKAMSLPLPLLTQIPRKPRYLENSKPRNL